MRQRVQSSYNIVGLSLPSPDLYPGVTRLLSCEEFAALNSCYFCYYNPMLLLSQYRRQAILFSTFLTVHCHAIAVDASITTTVNLSSSVPPMFQCFSSAISDPRLASTVHCFEATRQLPLPADRAVGVFHHAPRPDRSDPWELPKSETFGSCTVTVDLAFVRFEYGSWAVMRAEIRDLIAFCSSGTHPHNRSGGISHVGMDDKIRVTVGTASGTGALSNGNLSDGSVLGLV